MKIIEPSFEFLSAVDGERILANIERIGRVCYKSEDKITADSARGFVARILKSGHESVIEHESLSVKVVCDRGVTHEIVRHRIAAYSQESTRYCNYSDAKFGSELTLIKPFFWNDKPEQYAIWLDTMQRVEDNYNKLIASGASPQEARSILPNSLKTELVMTMDLREWRHFFRLRTSSGAHPQMRQLACMMLRGFRAKIPVFFDDVGMTEL
jgi:thymidylate synthase (FAD)